MLKGSSLLPDTQTTDPEQQFQLLDMLGQGAYGSVSKALHKRSGNLYAVKILPATSLSEINSIKKEIQILKLCDNEHIVKYYGSYFKDNNLWIVLEYCHAGSIIDLINITQKKLNQSEIASILESVLEGLVYLHAHKKIHRDIKAANILLNNDGVAKLADFGVSTQSMHTNAGHKSQVGSPYWMSPEIMKQSLYTNKTDIWSLGVTAIELAEGVVPNSNLRPILAMWQLKDKPLQCFKEPQRWSQQFNQFVRLCLKIDPTERPQAKLLLKHNFITQNSCGRRLLAELVQHSLADIEEFRLGIQRSQDSESALIDMLNSSNLGGTKTIVHNATERSDGKNLLPMEGEQSPNFDSSMIVVENDGSMIVNDQQNSMIVDNEKQPTNFLNRYICGLKSNESEDALQKELMKKKVIDFDEVCMSEIESLFDRHRDSIKTLLMSGKDVLGSLDEGFVKNQFKSKLLQAENAKDFILLFPKFKDSKSFERSDNTKKRSQFSEMAHHSTQTNDPGYNDISQFREQYSRGVKSQEFNEKQFKTGEKHCFNSKSIISDMENMKYTHKDYPQEDNIRFGKNDKSNKRCIVTEPYEWSSIERRPFTNGENSVSDKIGLKYFLQDKDVKESLLDHIQSTSKLDPNALKYDRVAESTLYHEFNDDEKHQNSTTIIRGREFPGVNHFSEQNYLPNEQFDEEDCTEINTNLFQAKDSTGKNSKNIQPKKKRKNYKKAGNSSEKRAFQKNSVGVSMGIGRKVGK